jgi:hypothetical protein
MPDNQFPHLLPVLWEDVAFDRMAAGCTPRSAGDAALWVAMRPSVFLSIATPLPRPRPSLDWLRTRIDGGGAIAPAELVFDAHLRIPLALSHEGRHRMTALREKLCDRPVPVRLRLRGMDDFDIDQRLISKLRRGVRSQRGVSHIEGPLFEDAEVDMGGLFRSGVPPPAGCPMPPKDVQCIQRHLGVRMSKLGEFMDRVRQDARIGAVLVAAGLFGTLAAAPAAAASGEWGIQQQMQQKVLVDSLDDALELNERVSDQLGGMKALSDALNYSISYGSPNISGLQKARNLAIAFDFQLQQASHAEHADTDSHLVTAGSDPWVAQELRDMVEIVNAKKMELLEFSELLVEIEKALAAGDGPAVEHYSRILADMADDVQEKLYHDISVGYEDAIAPETARDI